MSTTEIDQGQLSFLIKHNNFPSLPLNLEPNSELRRLSESSAGHKLCHQNKEVSFMKVSQVVSGAV